MWGCLAIVRDLSHTLESALIMATRAERLAAKWAEAKWAEGHTVPMPGGGFGVVWSRATHPDVRVLVRGVWRDLGTRPGVFFWVVPCDGDGRTVGLFRVKDGAGRFVDWFTPAGVRLNSKAVAA